MRSVNSRMMSSRPRKSITLPTSAAFFVYLTATSAAPPGMPVQAAVPHGEPVATQSKFLPILLARLATCQLPE